MRALAKLSVACLLAFSLSGCILENLSGTRQLTDQVYALNDEIRWARIDLATERVAPDYRPTFLAQHRLWGHDIQIADSDTTHVQISDDSDSATSLVTLSWYDERTMELHTTVIQQRWVKDGDMGAFQLDLVRIVGGHPGLLEDPPEELEAEAESAGGETSSDGAETASAASQGK